MVDVTVPTLSVGAFRNEVALSLVSHLRDIINVFTSSQREVMLREWETHSRVPPTPQQDEATMVKMWQEVATWNDMHQRDFSKRMTARWLRLGKLCEDTYLCFLSACFEHIPNAADYTLNADIPKTEVILYQLLRMASHEPLINTGRFINASLVDQTILVQTIIRMTFNQLISLSNSYIVATKDLTPFVGL